MISKIRHTFYVLKNKYNMTYIHKTNDYFLLIILIEEELIIIIIIIVIQIIIMVLSWLSNMYNDNSSSLIVWE